MRASGTGFAVGVGRGGSVLAPIIAGLLFTYNYSLPSVALTMSFGSLVAAGILSFLKLETDQNCHGAAGAIGENNGDSRNGTLVNGRQRRGPSERLTTRLTPSISFTT